jgi:hypothetical protein
VLRKLSAEQMAKLDMFIALCIGIAFLVMNFVLILSKV